MIRLHDVVRRHSGGVVALDGVSLEVDPGELLAIVGPSGSGKSTLLNIMGTLDRPTEGSVRIAGQDVSRLDDRSVAALRAQSIGFVFQQFHLSPGRRALDEVADGLLYTGRPRSVRRQLAVDALTRVGLAARMEHRPHELSGGERQRVAIARAVAGAPPILLADEPTGALDTASGAGVMALLRDLHHDGTTVVVITHDREIAASLPRQVSMRDGRVVQDVGPSAAVPTGGAS